MAFIPGTQRVCEPKLTALTWKPPETRGGKEKNKNKIQLFQVRDWQGARDRSLIEKEGCPHVPPIRDSTRGADLCQASGPTQTLQDRTQEAMNAPDGGNGQFRTSPGFHTTRTGSAVVCKALSHNSMTDSPGRSPSGAGSSPSLVELPLPRAPTLPMPINLRSHKATARLQAGPLVPCFHPVQMLPPWAWPPLGLILSAPGTSRDDGWPWPFRESSYQVLPSGSRPRCETLASGQHSPSCLDKARKEEDWFLQGASESTRSRARSQRPDPPGMLRPWGALWDGNRTGQQKQTIPEGARVHGQCRELRGTA